MQQRHGTNHNVIIMQPCSSLNYVHACNTEIIVLLGQVSIYRSSACAIIILLYKVT